MFPKLWSFLGVIASFLGCGGGLFSFLLVCRDQGPTGPTPVPPPNPEGSTPTTTTPPPLNVLLIYGDDWRYDSLGSVTPWVHTPHLDALAASGMRFSHNCVTTSICWVSRATLWTGQYMSRHRSTVLRDPIFYHVWHNESWPALLQQPHQQHHSTHKYVVGHVGKWQFRNDMNFTGKVFNFSSIHEGQHSYGSMRATTRAVNDVRRFLDSLNVTHSNQPAAEQHERLSTTPLTPFAITVAIYPPKAVGDSPNPSDQLQARDDELAWYANLTMPMPYGSDNDLSYHRLPYFFKNAKLESRRRWKQTYNTSQRYQSTMKRYYALITEVDTAVGDIVQELKQRNLYDSTLIIFTTDNGYFHGEHGLAGKWFPYQESIRVPLIVRDPRMPKSRHGTVDSSFTLNIDLAPTILGAANVIPPQSMQGTDIAALYLDPVASSTMGTTHPTTTSRPPWRQEFYYEHHSMGKEYIPATSALVRKDYKYFLWSEWNKTELLFDLTWDPLEQDDLSNSPAHAAILNEMRHRHNELREQVK